MEELKKREEPRRQRGGDIGRKEQSQVTRAMPAIWTDWGLFCCGELLIDLEIFTRC